VNNPPLVIYHKQLGDVLMFEPALAKLAAFTGGTVRFSTRASFAPMISLMAEGGLAVSYIPEEVVTQAALSLWGRCVVQSGRGSGGSVVGC